MTRASLNVPAQYDYYQSETMNMENFISLNNSLANLKTAIPMEELLSKYKIELFDQNMGPNAIFLSNKRKDSKILQSRENIRRNFPDDIHKDLELITKVDAEIRKYNDHPKIVKLVLNKMSAQNTLTCRKGQLVEVSRQYANEMFDSPNAGGRSGSGSGSGLESDSSSGSHNTGWSPSPSPEAPPKKKRGVKAMLSALSKGDQAHLLCFAELRDETKTVQARTTLINLSQKHFRRRIEFARNEHMIGQLAK